MPISNQVLLPDTPAPDFSLPSTIGEALSLVDFRGQPVILAFYPADGSPVCSNQMALYNEVMPLFAEFNAQLLAISVDDISSHRAFAGQYNLGFPLLADYEPRAAVCRAYGVYNEDEQTSERALFVIDADGMIRWSYVSPRDVNPGANGILEALESLDT